jgi:hypothetical protein
MKDEDGMGRESHLGHGFWIMSTFVNTADIWTGNVFFNGTAGRGRILVNLSW